MYNQNPQNGQFYGSAPQAGVYPQQSFGAPQPYGAAPMNMPNQPFQPGQNPVQGNGWAQPVPQANPAQSGGQQDRLKYTPAIYEKPESGKPEDLVMTLVLGISTTQNLFFNKFLSKNGNVCVGVATDIVLSDQFVADMFGQHVVRPDHIVSLQFSFAGYTAKNFLEHIPNCTKNIIVQLKNFSVQSFSRRDGSQGMQIRANCVGMQVDHYSSKYKAGELKQYSTLSISSPYSVKDNTNGATAGQHMQNSAAGYPQPPQNMNPAGPQIPGVSRFEEMDDEELPF